jgi:hypothetical protein
MVCTSINKPSPYYSAEENAATEEILKFRSDRVAERGRYCWRSAYTKSALPAEMATC